MNKIKQKNKQKRHKKVITENNIHFSTKMFHPATLWIN